MNKLRMKTNAIVPTAVAPPQRRKRLRLVRLILRAARDCVAVGLVFERPASAAISPHMG
jgi:hypothetical protein|tara:strand:- start:3907 stop:4083 length:177 start_codon:yes stop_codon:yes gene_type:complete